MADADSAILLMLLAEDQAASVVAELAPDEIERLANAMADLGEVVADDAQGALDRFVAEARSHALNDIDGAGRTRRLLAEALGPRGDVVFARDAGNSERLAPLKWMRDDEILIVLAEEHPQAGAVILADLPAPRAARLLARLPAALQEELVARMARLDAVTPLALEVLTTLLETRAARPAPPPVDRDMRISGAAAVLSKMQRPADQKLIQSLGKRDKALARRIADEMFVFADVPRLDAKSLGVVVRAIDAEVLALALKGAPPAMRETLLGVLSQRAAEAIRDEIDERGPVPLTEVEAAQKQIVATVRRMEREGALDLGGGDQAYV